MPRPSHNLDGRRFGRLIVGMQRRIVTGRLHWTATCDCGSTVEVDAHKLVSGHTQSCGCLQRERSAEKKRTHGRGSTATGRVDPVHQAWSHMIQRCTNPKDPRYPSYGGRGIRVCDRWRASFADFLADVGERPSSEHSIDRKDNDGNYEPGNVRWATRLEQANNQRSNRRITMNDVTRTLAEWCAIRGVPVRLASQRLARGWTPERALSITVENTRPMNEAF